MAEAMVISGGAAERGPRWRFFTITYLNGIIKVCFYYYLVVILIGNGVLSWILKNTILWIFSESPPNLGRFHYEFTLTPAGGVGFAVGHGVGRVS